MRGRKKITLQPPLVTTAGIGGHAVGSGFSADCCDNFRVWARFRSVQRGDADSSDTGTTTTGAKGTFSLQETAADAVEIIVRYRPAFAELDTTWRVVIDGIPAEIEMVTPSPSLDRRKDLILRVKSNV